MIKTLSGENTFGLQAALEAAKSSFLPEYGELGLEQIDGEEADFSRLSEALTSLPFLASQKLVILRSPGKNKQFAEKLATLLAEIPETTEVIIVEPKLDKRSVYYKLLKKLTDFQEFPKLSDVELANWLVGQAKQRGGSISRGDAAYLVDRIGLNQQILSHELDKLLLYEPKITRGSIDQMTEAAPHSTIFQLLEAAFVGQTQKTLDLYQEQRSLKVEPIQIIAMLAWQLHILALVKTAGQRSPEAIAAEAKISPFVVRKSSQIARRISLAQLKKMISDLGSLDVRLKSQSLDPDEALQHYLLKLAG
jgi:DNA polymerase-3 subunit delta